MVKSFGQTGHSASSKGQHSSRRLSASSSRLEIFSNIGRSLSGREWRCSESNSGNWLLSMAIVILASSELASGALYGKAQYPYMACDSSKLLRCQQDVLRDLQAVNLNSASIQFPVSGPPYSPGKLINQQQQQQLVGPSTCRLVRSNLDCLLLTTPACYELGIQAAQNTDIMLRAKRFLEQNGCNEPISTWQATTCYRSPEIRACEERFGFTSAFAAGSFTNNVSACTAYQNFKNCVETHLRYNCRVSEMDMANEYFIDQANDLAWRCPLNLTGYGHSYSNQLSTILSPSVPNYSSFGSYEGQRIVPTYTGSHSGNILGPVREHPWERFRNPNDGFDSRYPIEDTSGRLVAGNSMDFESSDCPQKASPYARECEDTLLDQHRMARDSRDGYELQRRLCCSLFQYRDCISRVVLDRCSDSSPTAVEILMGVRRREMTLTCRGFNRDLCSGSVAQAILNLPVLISLATIISFILSKQTNKIHEL